MTAVEGSGDGIVERGLGRLRGRLEGVVLAGGAVHDEYTTNFGHIHFWRPRFLVKPAGPTDVLEVLKFAREEGLTVSTRGAAHSQSQLAINRDGILLDMRSMNRILEVDPKGGTVLVEPGVVWRDLLARTMAAGLAPPVLTNNLSVTVGGTLSMAGIGIASFEYGAQTDNVEELEVVTVDGVVRRCSRGHDPELFWGVLSGLGQVALILQARLRLRRPKATTRTYYLLYDDLRRFLEDAKAAMDAEKWDYLESWCSPCPQGLKWVGGVRQPYAKWFFPFHLTAEFDAGFPPDDAAMLAGLEPYANLLVDDLPTQDFLNRLIPVFETWKRAGTWEHVHPWMEVVLPWESATEYIEAVLADLPPGVQVGGHVLLWPARNAVSEVPLFMHPTTEYLIGFGILPAVPPKMWEAFRPKLDLASELAIAYGGKRYLSGYVNFTAEQWKAHYGEKWAGFAALKRKYDPEGRLNPGFIPF
ncbi:MAG TPA: FAD-binding protein [Planctomycetota bacterium]|nr:FAD-binding protein [Planctomycetota bacterium]